MPVSKIIPFKEFVASLQGAEHEHFINQTAFAVQTPDHFEEMRNHLVSYYTDIEAVHSFADHNGQVWDCVPIELQPALRGGKEIFNPGPVPGNHPEVESLHLHQSVFASGEKDHEGNERICPRGSVLLRRLTLDELSRFQTLENYFKKAPKKNIEAPVADLLDISPEYAHEYAHAYEEIDNLGGYSILNIWRPPVDGHEQAFSLSQHWYVNGPDEDIQTVEAGWQVFPEHYHTHEPCLFIYWTADKYQQTGAYNNEDSNFVLSSNAWSPGQPLPASSSDGGTQAEIAIAWYFIGGNWCLYINGIGEENFVGYYPGGLYQGKPMGRGARSIDYGGEVCSLGIFPPMGSGKFANAGYRHAAYHRNIYCFTNDNSNPGANLYPDQQTPEKYTIEVANNAGWGSYFFYGGPGGQ